MKTICRIETREGFPLDILSSIRQSNHLTAQFGAPDELLLHSGGPEHDLAQRSLILGPALRRYLVRQRVNNSPRNPSISPLKGQLNVQDAPTPMHIDVEDWDGNWKYSHTVVGKDLADALRKISFDLPPACGESFQAGGLAGLLNYDMVQFTEPLLLQNLPPEESILMILYRADRWIVHNRNESSVELISAIDEDPWVVAIQSLLESGISPRPKVGRANPRIPESESDTSHANKVRQTQSAIRAGVLYQLNYGRIWKGKIDSPWNVFERLNENNPAPLSAWLHSPDLDISIASSSPELLLRQNGRTITTRPIKGTRPRGDDAEHDANLRGELVGSEKEIAEHLMLVDLERNDLGRICKTGSVYWKRWRIEAFPHVQHMVSEVEGILGDGKDGFDALQSVFPGGSITGCPKSATIAAIDELEAIPRRAWTGSIGHIDPRTEISQWNILIRTMESHFENNSWNAIVQAGGGLVIGSDPLHEVEEAKWKAQAICQAAWDYSPAGTTSEVPLGKPSVSIHPIPPLNRSIKQLIDGRETGLIRVEKSNLPEPIVWFEGLRFDSMESTRVLFIDNLDSFSWNIVHAFSVLGAEVIVVPGRNESLLATNLVEDLLPTHIVLGPGPGRPEMSKLTMEFANLAVEGNSLPLLGICLGHQAIGQAVGWPLIASPLGAVHGVPDNISMNGIPSIMTRYHSLILNPTKSEVSESQFNITAFDTASESLIMGIEHESLPIVGVQFHPESAGSINGISILKDFLAL